MATLFALTMDVLLVLEKIPKLLFAVIDKVITGYSLLIFMEITSHLDSNLCQSFPLKVKRFLFVR